MPLNGQAISRIIPKVDPGRPWSRPLRPGGHTRCTMNLRRGCRPVTTGPRWRSRNAHPGRPQTPPCRIENAGAGERTRWSATPRPVDHGPPGADGACSHRLALRAKRGGTVGDITAHRLFPAGTTQAHFTIPKGAARLSAGHPIRRRRNAARTAWGAPSPPPDPARRDKLRSKRRGPGKPFNEDSARARPAMSDLGGNAFH